MSRVAVRVFLSYSHDSAEHAERVRALAERLRADGVDCILDQYESAPPQGWPPWMEQQLEAADYVLVVATPAYRRRAAGRERPVTGHGVRFESVLAIQELYDAGMWNEKFIPVLFAEGRLEDLPPPLRPYTRYRLAREEDYEALYRHLTGQPLVRKSELGEKRELTELGPAKLKLPGVNGQKVDCQGTTSSSGAEAARQGRHELPPSGGLWRSARLGVGLGILGVLLTALAWLWPRPTPDVPARPAMYSVRVQVIDPYGRAVEGSTVRTSAGNEVQQLPDGWWELEIPLAKVPSGGQVTVWAEHAEWAGSKAVLQLSEDPNPRTEIRLQAVASHVGGVVVNRDGAGLPEARVSARNYVAEPAVSGPDGRFALQVEAAEGRRVRVRVEHPEFRPVDTFCYTGRDSCSVLLGGS